MTSPPVAQRGRQAVGVRDVVLVVIAAMANAIMLEGFRSQVADETLATLGCVALVSVGSLFWRRRFPVSITVLALLAAFFGMGGGLVVALFSLAVRNHGWTLAALAVAAVSADSIAVWLVPGLNYQELGAASPLVDLAVSAITVALITGAGVAVGRRRARRPLPGTRSVGTAGEFLARVGPRARDVALMLLAFALDSVTVATANPAWPQTLVWVTLGASLLSASTLWWRRRYPVAVTVFGLLFALVSLHGAVLGGLVTLAIRRRDRMLALLAAASVLATLPATIVQDGATSLVGATVGAGLTTGAVVAFGAYIGARRDLVESLRERADRAEAERELRADQARLSERARIAGEMHDVLAHKVSLIALHAGGLEVVPNVGTEQVQRTAGLIRSTARESLEDLRDVLGVLRAPSTEPTTETPELAHPLGIDQIHRLVQASRAAGVVVQLMVEVAGDPPPAVSRTAHRVVQESLTNVHKHARSAATTVRLHGAPRIGLDIVVINAVPVAVGSLLPGAGMGLVGLAERVSLLGGMLDHGQTPGGGWQLHAHLPWPEQGDAE